MAEKRAVVWFSCGATSAVAAKLATREYSNHDLHVVYCDTQSEHHDNRRFLHDVEEWIDHPVEVLRSDKYRDVWDVWRKTKWLAGIHGARCTTELKKTLRHKYQKTDDIQIFGFDASEESRVAIFIKNNPEIDLQSPLIDRGLYKADCLALLENAGIEPPAMYRLGFPNANCVGCVKGGQAYWNHIRKVFPETFIAMAKMERRLDVAINKSYAGDGKRKRIFLDELEPTAGRGDLVTLPECSLLCGATEAELENEG